MVPFLVIDLVFFGANLLKVFDGGWMPLALGACIMVVMYTWRRGSRLLFEKTRKSETPLDRLWSKSLERKPPLRVPGTAVFLTSDPSSAPTALLHSLKHYKVLHEKNVILTVETMDVPRAHASDRVSIEPLGETFSRVVLRFGFMETPNVPRALAVARKHGWQFDIMSTSFFLSRRAVKRSARRTCRAGRTICSSALDPHRERRDRLFPDPDRAGGRGRHAGHGLMQKRSVRCLTPFIRRPEKGPQAPRRPLQHRRNSERSYRAIQREPLFIIGFDRGLCFFKRGLGTVELQTLPVTVQVEVPVPVAL